MGRKRQRDVVDFMHQRPEQRLRELSPDDLCHFCDAASSDYGPEHNTNCPRFISQEELDGELDDVDMKLLEKEYRESLEEDEELFI